MHKYGVHANEQTTFVVHSRQVRVRVDDEISPALADRIMGFLEAGKIKFKEETARSELRGIDLSIPQEIGLQSGTRRLIVTYQRGELEWVCLECSVGDDEITVVSVGLVIS